MQLVSRKLALALLAAALLAVGASCGGTDDEEKPTLVFSDLNWTSA